MPNGRRRWMLLAAPLAAAVGLGLAPRAGAAGQPLAVYPVAGTPDASATTQISFRGAVPRFAGLHVVGSESGVHTGSLRLHSDKQGASFLPSKPFADGEMVTVRTDESLVGADNGVVSFTVAAPPGPFDEGPHFPDPAGSPPEAHRYVSRPDLAPPTITAQTYAPGASTGALFLAPKLGPGQDGALITDAAGRTIWFHPVGENIKVYDFKPRVLHGKPVLTWWQGVAAGGDGRGDGYIVDSSYRRIARVRAANGYKADIHEFLVTPHGTAIMAVYDVVRGDLTPLGDFVHHAVTDSIVQEVDLKTGLVLFEWHSLGHVPLTESFVPSVNASALDYFHVNSIDLQPDGNFLVSGRNTSAVYEIDRTTGNVLWRLGGKKSDFALPPEAHFLAQHDVRMRADGTLSMFDNGTFVPPAGARKARGLVLRLDQVARTASVVEEYDRGLATISQGSVQTLPNGNVFVGWGGSNPFMSEFSATGTLLYDAQIMTGSETYRAFRRTWIGRPQAPPALAAIVNGGTTTVYASWNGDTQTRRWQVLGGPTKAKLAVVASASRAGFETAIRVRGVPKFVAVRAVGGTGEALKTSPVIATKP